MPSLWEISGTLIKFIPQIFLLYFILSLVEHSGLLAVLAKAFHLPLQNVLPVCLSFSCTTLGICATRENHQQKRLIKFLSFIPCAAQLPLITYLLFSVLHLPMISLVLVYLIGLCVGYLMIIFTAYDGRQTPTAEPIRLQFPNLWHCGRDTFKQTLVFAKKIFITFVCSAFVIVILARFSFNFKMVNNPKDSILFSFCGLLSPVFSPIGLGNPAIICALLFGVIAKESAISVLLLFPQVLSTLTTPMILSLVVFYALYPKCISAQAAMCSQCNRKFSLQMFITNLLVAYLLAFVVYTSCGTFIKL